MTGIKPIVLKKGAGIRFGKGFSINELKAAGVTVKWALRQGIPLDLRRRTLHEENVKNLQKLLKAGGKREKPGRSRKAADKPKSQDSEN